jgi:hypothetical protein
VEGESCELISFNAEAGDWAQAAGVGGGPVLWTAGGEGDEV